MSSESFPEATPPDDRTNPQQPLDEDVVRQIRRLGRAEDYLEEAFAIPDSLRANVGSVNYGLMRMAIFLDESLQRTLRDASITAERESRIFAGIDAYLRVARQIDRHAQFEERAMAREERRRRTSEGPGPQAE